MTFVSRSGDLTKPSEPAPFGHSRPREIGESGSPSIWITCSSLTNTRCPHPTAQYGQTDLTTLSASLIRGVSVSERFDCAAIRSPSGSLSCRTRGGMSERLANLIGTVPLEWAGHPHRSRSDVLGLGRMAAYPRRLPWLECWAIVGLVAAFGFAMALSLHHDCTVAPSEVDAPEPGTPRATFCEASTRVSGVTLGARYGSAAPTWTSAVR